TASFAVVLLLVGVVHSQRRPTARPAAPTVDYTKFSHATTKHQGACITCHKIPSPGWQKASTYPDVRDYPGHEACVSCHRPQFFKGARPPICAVCHSKTSPRDEARFPFRNPASSLQFNAKFPHDKHQDVIALFRGGPADSSTALFAHARFRIAADDHTYHNCTICHIPQAHVPKPLSTPPTTAPSATYRRRPFPRRLPGAGSMVLFQQWRLSKGHLQITRPVSTVIGSRNRQSRTIAWVATSLPSHTRLHSRH